MKKNRDKDRLRIMYFDEVNLRARLETFEFVSKNSELIEILRYWSREFLSYDLDVTCTVAQGSQWRILFFASRRIDRRADKEVRRRFREAFKIDDELWKIYLNGTPEQRKYYRERLWTQFKSRNSEK